MPTADWSTRFNCSDVTQDSKQIDLSLLVFKKSNRPQRDDVNNVAIFKQIISEVKPSACAIVFTYCDEGKFDKAKAGRWYKALVDGIEGMPEIPEERMFLFHGDPEEEDATTTEEIREWVVSVLPESPEEAAQLKTFDYENYLVEGEASANENIRSAAA